MSPLDVVHLFNIESLPPPPAGEADLSEKILILNICLNKCQKAFFNTTEKRSV